MPAPTSVFALAQDRRPATRLAGLLALTVAGLGAVLTLGVSRWPAPAASVLLALLATVGATGALALVRPMRVPVPVVAVALLAGTAFVSVGMLVAGRDSVEGADNEMLFLVPLLFTAYFCRVWLTAAVVAVASLGYLVVLLHARVPLADARWLTTSVALALVAALVAGLRRRDGARLDELGRQARCDTLTGLLNRRGLAAATAELSGPVSLLLLDLDHFKRVNDTYGHDVGDNVLVRVAAELRTTLRSSDVVARIGGEEFAVLLPACDASKALGRAEELRRELAERSMAWTCPVTVSIGTATAPTGSDLSGLLSTADRALYEAKAAGRDTVRGGEPAHVVPPLATPSSSRTAAT